MRIATWNVERLRHRAQLPFLLEHCRSARADILILTETDRRMQPECRYSRHTPPAKDCIPGLYHDTENRVSIYTDFELVRRHETYDEYTAVCVELKTSRGNLIVYGTIMGIHGNREKSYIRDLAVQMKDVRRLSALGDICVAGDFNCSFSDNYYFTKHGRDTVVKGFCDRNIAILTEKQPECIDHIAVSKRFLAGAEITVDEWNRDKALSDHKGIVAEITWQ